MNSKLLRYDQRYEMILANKLEAPDDIACEPQMLDFAFTQFYGPHEQQWLQQIEPRYQ